MCNVESDLVQTQHLMLNVQMCLLLPIYSLLIQKTVLDTTNVLMESLITLHALMVPIGILKYSIATGKIKLIALMALLNQNQVMNAQNKIPNAENTLQMKIIVEDSTSAPMGRPIISGVQMDLFGIIEIGSLMNVMK